MSDKLPGFSLTALSALVYGAGFIVTNTHLSRFVPVGFDLLRGRYLAAGLVYCMVVLPAVAGAALGAWGVRQSLMPSSRTPARRRVSVALSLVGSVLLAVLWSASLFEFISADPDWPLIDLLLCIALPCLIFWVIYLGWALESRFHLDRPVPTAFYTYGGTGFMLFALIQSASSFGQDLYPRVSPSFGGGASWVADVAFSQPLIIGTDTVWASGAAVLDQAEDYVVLLLCPPNATSSDLLPVSISRDRVQALVTEPDAVVVVTELRRSGSALLCS